MTVNSFSFIRRTRRLCWLIMFVIAGLGGLASPVFASQSVELTWVQSTSANIVAYEVFYGTQSHQYTSSTTFGNVSDATIPGLTGGQTYYFAVCAIDANGDESGFSSEVVYTAPAPSSITLQVQGSTAAWAVDVSWTPSSDSGVFGYVVYYGTQSGVYNNSATFYYATEGTIPGLAGGTTYYFAVAPIDGNGIESIASSEVSYTIPNPVPLVLQAQMPTNSAGVELTWNAVPNEGIVSYNVYYGTQSGSYDYSLNCGNVNNFLVQGLEPGQTYYFEISAVDAYGNEDEFSNEANSPAAAPVPIYFQVQGTTVAMQAVNVSWRPSADTNVYGYAVYYGTQSGVFDNYVPFYDATNGVISGLAADTTYYFAIAPIDSFGLESIASTEVPYTVPIAEPLVVQATVLTNSPGVELSWNAITNAGIVDYNVYYGTESGNYFAGIGCGDVTNYVVEGLEGGQTYYFVVISVDAYGNESPYSNEASAVAPNPAPMILQTQTYTDGNGQPYAMEINTPSTVYGNWEMDYSTDLQNWTPYTYGYGSGTGDGYDVDAFVSIDPTQPQMFFRVINY
jgi:fibronectin type 3 domain-containing protein